MKKGKNVCQRDRLHDKLEMVDEAYLDIIEDRLDAFIGKTDSDFRQNRRKKR